MPVPYPLPPNTGNYSGGASSPSNSASSGASILSGSSSSESPPSSLSSPDLIPTYYYTAASPGPSAILYRIESLFGTHTERQDKLDALHAAPVEAVHPQLQMDVGKLAGYLQPSYPLLTQLHALKTILLLTTRLPGTRKIFYQDPTLQSLANSPQLLTQAWETSRQSGVGGVGLGWQFYLKLVVFCLAESPLAKLMEENKPSVLACLVLTPVESGRERTLGGRGGTEGLESSVIELLLHHCKSGPEFGVSRISAIRYLDGLLQLPAFWHGSDSRRLTDVLGQICNAIAYMVHDADFYPHGENKTWLSPAEPVDDFAHTLFVGIAGAVHRFLFCPPGLASIVNLFMQDKFAPSYPKSANFAPIVKHLIIDYFGSSAGALASNGMTYQSIEYHPSEVRSNTPANVPHPSASSASHRPLPPTHHRNPTADHILLANGSDPSPSPHQPQPQYYPNAQTQIITMPLGALQPVRFAQPPSTSSTRTTFSTKSAPPGSGTSGGLGPKTRKLVKKSKIRWPSS